MLGSFFPLVQKIPLSFVEILNRAEVDFTLLGGENGVVVPSDRRRNEKGSEILIQHNLEAVKNKGVEKVVSPVPPAITPGWRNISRILKSSIPPNSSRD